MEQHHLIKFCDPEITWQTNKDFDNMSETKEKKKHLKYSVQRPTKQTSRNKNLKTKSCLVHALILCFPYFIIIINQ